ncbi:MAG: YihY/virulence factor BrkB family protein [Balneola sp.]|nr:YihY/virulence factor BrkB family protein [Balneola sp.]MBO6651108.1 YihY/virulence factor BrkB family protein [Balneola sp.]MBO6712767.1 YihY/virulence factor BrkB family protein [Balneola sp.]MBO6801066.1 YihY/virulence factor BrkB family protein [Balneola sp.]MBO6871258.1 YihY/virulence factor BrkB family protein [Balneola sp.]
MKYWKILKKALSEYGVQDAMNYSSSIAFYLIFSLPAILIITIYIAGSVYEDQVVRDSLLEQFNNFFGQQSAEAIDKILTNVNEATDSLINQIIGFLTLVVSATTVFVSLQDGINKVWGIVTKPDSNLYRALKNRLLSLAMAVSVGFLLLVSLVIEASLNFFDSKVIEIFSESEFYLANTISFSFSVIVTTAVFACLFKIIPDAEVKWKNVWMGALITTVLFGIGKYMIGFYLGVSSFGSVYGAAGSLVILLTWIFYSSMIVLFGAQYTAVYSEEI